MKLPLDGSAVVARLPVSSPIFRFLTVTNTLAFDTADYNRWLQLCCLNLRAHGVRSGLTKELTRAAPLTYNMEQERHRGVE